MKIYGSSMKIKLAWQTSQEKSRSELIFIKKFLYFKIILNMRYKLQFIYLSTAYLSFIYFIKLILGFLGTQNVIH